MANDPFLLVAIGACLVVLLILLWGIGTYAKGGEDSAKKSNKIMQYRLLAQFIAVCIIVAYVSLRGGGG